MRYYCIDCKKEITMGSILGRCKSCSHKGELNSMFGKSRPDARKRMLNNNPRTPEQQPSLIDGRSLGEHFCIDCGEKVSSYLYKRCQKCKSKGENNGRFVDGSSKFPYPLEFNDELKELIRKRDNYICQNSICNMTEEEHLIILGRTLEVHHIDYDKNNCRENNLITLCQQCNLRANINRDYWKNLYQQKIKR